MSLTEDTTEIAASLISFSISKAPETSKTGVYQTPSNSPPQRKSNVSKAQGEIQDRLHSEAVSSVLSTPSTSPQDSSKLEPQEESSAESMDASTLIDRLGLKHWECGCLTQDNLRCRNLIKRVKRPDVDSLIRSMTGLTQSSPELISKLDRLASLVHCRRHHNNDLDNASRIEDWKTKFLVGENDIDQAVPAEKLIRKVLPRISPLCGWTGPENKPCEKRIGGQRVQNCTKTIDKIVMPEVYLDDASLDFFLGVLDVNMYCNDHVNTDRLGVALWKESILGIRKSVDLKLMMNRGLLTPRHSPSLSPESERGDPVTFWLPTYDTRPFDIIKRRDRLADHKSSYDLVRKKITGELTTNAQKEGFVYVYEVPGNEGFVKIGYATDLETRLGEWRFDCNREVKVLYPIPAASAETVQNAPQVEALCHAELRHRKTTIYCDSCLRKHIEWFEISTAEAIAVVRKWEKWMRTSPYKSTELRDGAKHTLKEEERRRTRDIEQFLKEISEA